MLCACNICLWGNKYFLQQLLNAKLFTCVNNVALYVIELFEFLHGCAIALGNAFETVTIANSYILCGVLLSALALTL